MLHLIFAYKSGLGGQSEMTHRKHNRRNEHLPYSDAFPPAWTLRNIDPYPHLGLPSAASRPHDPKRGRLHPSWRLENKLLTIRVARNMTQAELASLVGVTRQTISRIEKRRHEPALSLALAIAEALELPLQNIFKLKRPTFNRYE